MDKRIVLALVCTLLASCGSPELVPPPQPSPIASQTPFPTQEATASMSPVPPSNEPIVGTPVPRNRPTQPFDPKSGDANLQRGNVFIDSAQVLTMESNPPQFSLMLTGNLPTPCNKLRVEVMEPDQNGVIQVDAYSVIDPNKACSQVLSPFKANIPMGTFAPGSYTVAVNRNPVGKIKVP